MGLGEIGSQPARTTQLALAKTARPAATRTEGRLTRALPRSTSSSAKQKGDEGGARGKQLEGKNRRKKRSQREREREKERKRE